MVVCKFILLVFSGGDSLLLIFIYLLFYLFIYLFIIIIIINIFFSDSVIIFVVIEIFLLGLFCPRLDWEYLCLELLGVLGQIDDCF